METFSGKKPDVSPFRIFGSSIYCHVSREVRKNLESTIELGIFVGYIDTPYNYWLYFPSPRMIVVKRYVKFDEEKIMWCSLERELELQPNQEILDPK